MYTANLGLCSLANPSNKTSKTGTKNVFIVLKHDGIESLTDDTKFSKLKLILTFD